MTKSCRIISFGLTAIDTIVSPSASEGRARFNESSQSNRLLGGEAANIAVAATKQENVAVSLLSAVGNDAAGQWALQRLQSHGIDTSLVQIKRASSVQFQIDPADSGPARLLVDDHAGKHLSVESVSLETLKNFNLGIAHIPYVWESLLSFLDKSKAAGLKTIFNPSPIGLLKDISPVEKADLIITNAGEAAVLCQKLGITCRDIINAATLLKQKTGKDFIVTLGERGSVAAIDDEVWYAPARKTEVIDPTGAGDAFIGFFAVSRQSGLAIRDCLQIATAAASLVREKTGAAESAPGYDKVQVALAETPVPRKQSKIPFQKEPGF